MSVGLFGADVLIKNLRKAREAADKAAEREVKKAAKAVETDAKIAILKGPKTGCMYTRIREGGYIVVYKDYEEMLSIITQAEGDAEFGQKMKAYHTVAIYKDDGKNLSRDHRASAPGESPATDTGELATSIMSKMDILAPGKASAVVWTDKPYGKYLEFGTKKIEPRPWLTPAVEKNRERFPGALGKAVIKSVDDAVKK